MSRTWSAAAAARAAALLALVALVGAQGPAPEVARAAGSAHAAASEPPAQPSTPAPTLLSAHEFVDYTEAPTLLFGDEEPNQGAQNQTTTTTTKHSSQADQPAASSGTNAGTSSDIAAAPDPEAGPAAAPFEPPQDVSEYMDYIERLGRELRQQLADLFAPHLARLVRGGRALHLSSSCQRDLFRLAMALRQLRPWALKMLDSSGKLPEGILEGSFTALGSYDQCLGVNFESALAGPLSDSENDPESGPEAELESPESTKTSTPQPETTSASEEAATEPPEVETATNSSALSGAELELAEPPTQGKYCLVHVSPYLPPRASVGHSAEREFRNEAARRNYAADEQLAHLSAMFYYMKFRIGACLPSSCLDSDTGAMAEALSAQLKLNISIASCRQRQHLPLSGSQLAGLLAFGLALALVLVASLADYARLASLPDSLAAFSALANFKRHFMPNRKLEACTGSAPVDSRLRLACLDGVRVLSLCWLIVANSYITLDPRATKRLTKTREAPRDFLFQLVVQASLAIETFFFLSGLVAALGLVKLARLSKPASWPQLYLHRYIRLTPAAMLVVALAMFMSKFGDGPLWLETTERAHASCARNWWRHLLHVANLVDTRQTCFVHFWYIAADMQLYLLAPPLVALLTSGRPRLGYMAAAALGLASFYSVFSTTYQRNLPPTLLFYSSDPESRREFGNSVMTKPLSHALPYLVGLLLGVWLDGQLQAAPKRRPWLWRRGSEPRPLGALLGAGALALALAALFLPYRWNNSQLPGRLAGALYAASFRLGWALALAYLVAACAHRRGRKCGHESARPRPGQPAELWLKAQGDKMPVQLQLQAPPEADPDGHQASPGQARAPDEARPLCLCPTGGSLVNRLLGLRSFGRLAKLCYVAYLVHLPLMSVFIAQTRALFAFSHALVMHLALSYLLITFGVSFVLVHVIEFPFGSLERRLLLQRSAGLGWRWWRPRSQLEVSAAPGALKPAPERASSPASSPSAPQPPSESSVKICIRL